MNNLEIIAEIDFIYWQLSEFKKKLDNRKPIEIMIDDATGFEKKELKSAMKLIKRAKKLRKILEDE